MKIGFYNYYSIYNNNRMFLSTKSPIGDNLSYPTYYLGNFLKKRGYEVSTIDTGDIDSYDIVIFFDLPNQYDSLFNYLVKKKHKKLYLFIVESPLIRPENWQQKNHVIFNKVFTWNDQFIDSKKYFKFFLANKLQTHFSPNVKSKFCTIISGNKIINKNKNELYSERNRAIRWFEKNHPQEFDLYGFGWDDGEPKKYLKTLIRLNRTTCKLYAKSREYPILKKLLKSFHIPYPSYRGKVDSKNRTLLNYKFSICYENATNIPGYITEKIFDCFFAGCIPIYLGAPNIKDFIPQSTFIDKREFDTYEELYLYLKQMPEDECQKYQQEISNFLLSQEIKKFSAEFFAETIYKNIILDQ